MILRKKKLTQASKKLTHKTKSISILKINGIIATVIISLITASILAIKCPVEAQEKTIDTRNNKQKSEIRFTNNNESVIQLAVLKPLIITGESAQQRESREKAEAESRAREELSKKRSAKTANTSITIVKYNDPADFSSIYKAAEARFGVDASILKAIHFVETGCTGSTDKTNYSGATGPMQFLASTFRRHAIDGNNDGVVDIYNVEDAVFTAAAYLRACGYPNIKSALYGYNPSASYFRKVMEVATTFGYTG